MKSFASACSVDTPERIHIELPDLVLKVADQVFAESASNFERALASRILGRKYENFKVLTIEDFLADIVCGGEKWREYKKKIQHLGYMVELAPLVLYILVEDQRLDDAKELFDLVNKTEATLQKQSNEFTDIYVEIMKWVAKKMGISYSPPRNCIKFSEDYPVIVQTVLNYHEISDSHEILRAKHIAQKKISEMASEGIWDVRILYFAWKLSRLLSLPQLSLKDQIAFISWRRRKNWIIYRAIHFLPEILILIASIIAFALTESILVVSGTIIAFLLAFLRILFVKHLPQQIQKLINRWSYYVKVKSELEKDEQLLKDLKRLIF
uniref:Uncharacterized protein n=1 Tax=candidate division WOR-3 bacterium TaxID=2052148 RepID=A0A7C2P1X1_UNCW3